METYSLAFGFIFVAILVMMGTFLPAYYGEVPTQLFYLTAALLGGILVYYTFREFD